MTTDKLMASVLAIGALAVATYAVVNRYDMVFTGREVVRLDRWTGDMLACGLQSCAPLGGK